MKIRNVYWSAHQRNEGSHDTENALKLLQIASTGINYILKHMDWENYYFDIIGPYK